MKAQACRSFGPFYFLFHGFYKQANITFFLFSFIIGIILAPLFAYPA